MKELLEKVSTLRHNISSVIKLLQALGRTREIALAITKAEEGFMFLGKVKQQLGSVSPYPVAIDKVSSVIEDAVDITIGLEGSKLSIIKRLRFMLQDIVSDHTYNALIDQFSRGKVIPGNLGYEFTMESLMSIVAAKMWLGMEINNIAHAVVSKVRPALKGPVADAIMDKAVPIKKSRRKKK